MFAVEDDSSSDEDTSPPKKVSGALKGKGAAAARWTLLCTGGVGDSDLLCVWQQEDCHSEDCHSEDCHSEGYPGA